MKRWRDEETGRRKESENSTKKRKRYSKSIGNSRKTKNLRKFKIIRQKHPNQRGLDTN